MQKYFSVRRLVKGLASKYAIWHQVSSNYVDNYTIQQLKSIVKRFKYMQGCNQGRISHAKLFIKWLQLQYFLPQIWIFFSQLIFLGKKGERIGFIYFLKQRHISFRVYERIPSSCLVIVKNAKSSPENTRLFLLYSNFPCHIAEYEIKNGFNYLGVTVMMTLRYHQSLKGNLC